MKQLDVRGLSWQEPVVSLKPLLEEGEDTIEVLCSCGASSDNIKRMASHYGYAVEVLKEEQGEITYHLQKQ